MRSSGSNFIDYVKIFCTSGNGGGGSCHFSKSKVQLNGKPDGGDGGDGGSVIIKGDRNTWTLLHLKYTKHISAKNGNNGSKNQKFGADGGDYIIKVPWPWSHMPSNNVVSRSLMCVHLTNSLFTILDCWSTTSKQTK